jgi:hypothetical protein
MASRPASSTVRECTLHYAILTIEARQKARMLLTRPTFRLDRKSRTWLLDPSEIEMLMVRLQAEAQQLN